MIALNLKALAELLLSLSDKQLGKILRKALSADPILSQTRDSEENPAEPGRPLETEVVDGPGETEVVDVDGLGPIEVCEAHGLRHLVVAKTLTEDVIELLCDACPWRLRRPLPASACSTLATAIARERATPIPSEPPR